MQCKHCGKTIPEDSRICPECGQTLPVTLNMSVGAWEPDLAAEYLTVSWNREGSELGVGSVTRATFTLAVSASVTGLSSFSFDVTVTGFE